MNDVIVVPEGFGFMRVNFELSPYCHIRRLHN
jgi:hypothetical protein